MFSIIIGVAAAAVTYLVEDKIDQKIQEKKIINAVNDAVMRAVDKCNRRGDE
jgi:hypothetical protein